MAASEAMPARVPMSLHSVPEVGMPRLRRLVRMVSTSAWLATMAPTAVMSTMARRKTASPLSRPARRAMRPATYPPNR
jgi:hypothetical protein